jgi:HAD superfamily phosphatase (TIGR01681 family)
MKVALSFDNVPACNLPVPDDIVTEFNSFAERVVARSEIVWGEHCSECAAPLCYSECSFFSPRADLTCRRFVAGFEPVENPGSEQLHRIRFRKWGKLEGLGPAPVHPIATVQRGALVDSALTILTGIPQPFMLKRRLISRCNQRRSHSTIRSFSLHAHAFVVESWSADASTHPFTITFLEKPGSKIYQERFEIGPHYGRLAIPLERIKQNLDLSLPYLIQIEPSDGSEGCDVLGIADFVRTREAPPTTIPGYSAAQYTIDPRAKVVVWDLDNTLWDGILGEDGIDGIVLRPDFAAIIVELDRRGILHSVASKNDEREALAALRRFGLLDYFLYPQINWRPKSESIYQISRALDLGIDSFVFIDDQQFELGEVIAAHPICPIRWPPNW